MKNSVLYCTLTVVVLFFSSTYAQQNSDIILWDMKWEDGKYSFSNPVNVTNRDGYDNQPHFSADGQFIYYSSIREKENSDIFLYSLKTKEHKRITNTKEAEYSPTLLGNEEQFSTVRVEKDNKQRLWVFPAEGRVPQLITPHIDSIGYHCWLSPTTIAIFRIEETMNLKTIHTDSKKMEHIAKNIGRCLILRPNSGHLTYVSKENQKQFTIQEWDWNKKESVINPIIHTVKDSEDFTWTSRGDLLMAHGSKVYKYSPHKDKDWVEVLNAETHKLGPFNRIAVNKQNNKLALVMQKD